MSVYCAASVDPQQLLRRSAVRCATAALTLSLAALATGCRHESKVAYQPAPPPIPARHASSHTTTAHASTIPGGKPSAATPMSPEAQPTRGFDDTSGKPVLTEFGVASWYGPNYHQRAAADGSIFDQNAMTAAHRTLPMGSTVRVTNVATGQNTLVRITDRGPFAPGRILDLSLGAAKAIGIWRAGVAQVKVEAFAHATSNPGGRWCVQIGAFKNPDDALDVKAALVDRFKNARVIEFAGPTGHWVRVNPSTPDLAHANQVAKALESPDPAALPYIVRTD